MHSSYRGAGFQPTLPPAQLKKPKMMGKETEEAMMRDQVKKEVEAKIRAEVEAEMEAKI